MWSFFSSAPSSVGSGANGASDSSKHVPRCFAFVTHSLHIHAGSTFCNIIQETMKSHTPGAYVIHLNNFEDEDSQNILVTVKKVLELSKVMRNIASHQTFECIRGQVPVMVGFEAGRLEHTLEENDVIMIFTLHKSIQRTFFEKRIGRYQSPVYVVSFISPNTNER